MVTFATVEESGEGEECSIFRTWGWQRAKAFPLFTGIWTQWYAEVGLDLVKCCKLSDPSM